MDYTEARDAIDGIYAYDTGCVSSGIRDESLRAKVREWLQAKDKDEQRIALSSIMRDLFLVDEAIEQGYGWEDALSFGRWLEDDSRLW